MITVEQFVEAIKKENPYFMYTKVLTDGKYFLLCCPELMGFKPYLCNSENGDFEQILDFKRLASYSKSFKEIKS